MKVYQYRCKLLTDVIITSDAATEGYSEALDYIPGAKFLGIVAGELYNMDDADQTLDLFHNGTVQYGDACPFIQEEPLFKVPFSWFYAKGDGLSDTIYLHHKIKKNSGIQLKQARTGYFSFNKKFFTSIEQDFALKSAQDAFKRKSAKGQMFGYFSLKAGTNWGFTVKDKNGKYADEIKRILIGKHRIGRSRSAEFGLVEITFDKEIAPEGTQVFKDEIVIYAQSNLCFYDTKTGQTTAQPIGEQLTGDKDSLILWDKSQVRSRNYKTWNRHRANKDSERIIIERGSVFLVKLGSEVSSAFFENGIGSYLNEGFGSVLINPVFLESNVETLPFTLKKQEPVYQSTFIVEKGENDTEILKSLEQIKLRADSNYQVSKRVNDFIKEHKSIFNGISKSQWGVLRNYGKNLDKIDHFEKLIFDKKSGFLYTGQSEKEWRAKDRRGILKNYLSELKKEQISLYFPFIVQLSNQMAKN